MTKSIFHVDANSADLSWTAVDLLEHGSPLDICTVPSVIAGGLPPKTPNGMEYTRRKSLIK